MSDYDINCFVWGTPAGVIKAYLDAMCMDSPRTGGRYLITDLAMVTTELEELDNATKARLTTWLIDQRFLGEECPQITTETIVDAAQRRNLPIYERMDRFLRYLSHIEPFVGGRFGIDEVELLHAQAWSESKMTVTGTRDSKDERQFFLDSLEAKGWINIQSGGCLITVEGHAHLEELERRATDSSQAFVAMWFDDSMEDVWKDGINRGIEDAGYKALRIDRKEHANKIDDEIIAEIRRSRFIVADFTHGRGGARGGVYYEAGFAYGLDIPVIFTCRKNALKKIHFDTRQYNHLVWGTPEELRRKLAMRIAAVVGDGPLRVNQVAGSLVE